MSNLAAADAAPPSSAWNLAGMLMTRRKSSTPVAEYDENYTYELIHGVLVVNPIPNAEEKPGRTSCWDTCS